MDIRGVCDVILNFTKDATYPCPHSLQRTNGRFADADLARILQNATSAPACAFGARRTPEVLRVAELLSIEQGRKWGACTVKIFHFTFLLVPYSSYSS